MVMIVGGVRVPEPQFPWTRSSEAVGILKDLLGLIECLLGVVDIAGLDSLLHGAVGATPVGLVLVESELLD